MRCSEMKVLLPLLMLLLFSPACKREELPPETPREDREVTLDPGMEEEDPLEPGEAAGNYDEALALCVDIECEEKHMAYPWDVPPGGDASAWFGFPIEIRLSLVRWDGKGTPDSTTVFKAFDLPGVRLNADVHILSEPYTGHTFYGSSRDAVRNSLGEQSEEWQSMLREFALARMAFRADGEPINHYFDYSSTMRISEIAERTYKYCHYWMGGGKAHPEDAAPWDASDLYVGSVCDAGLPLRSFRGDVFLKAVDEIDGADLSVYDPVLTELLDCLQRADDWMTRLRIHKRKLFGNNFGWGKANNRTEWRSFRIALENVSVSGLEGAELTHVLYRFRADGTPYWWKPVDGTEVALPIR